MQHTDVSSSEPRPTLARPAPNRRLNRPHPPHSYWLRPGYVVSTANVGAPLQFLPKLPEL